MNRSDAPPAADETRTGRGTKNRQRQRLIDACISALHIHGPSRTTVEKVVAIANLSPGIVRFYFKSKAAMLVASLQYLATEFDEKVLVPVMAMRDTPVQAMRRLVDLYLDPELASPRKISVWYAFWGEATSRQEYYEICGQKDDSFVALVRELMQRLVLQSGEKHLDVDAISIGFIGLLEVLWQGFAFQSEADIDRQAARERCYAYLRSIFPSQFTSDGETPTGATRARRPAGFATRDCEAVILESAQIVAHETELPALGDVLALEVGGTPVMIVRSQDGRLRALENRCTHSPHELMANGHHRGLQELSCALHGERWSLSGGPVGQPAPPALNALPIRCVNGVVMLLPALPERAAPHSLIDLLAAQPYLEPFAAPRVWQVAADWNVVVEHWLDVWLSARSTARLGNLREAPRVELDEASGRVDWVASLDGATGPWTLRHFSRLSAQVGEHVWSRHFIAPNTVVDRHAGGLSLMLVTPVAAGECRIETRAYIQSPKDKRRRALAYLALRLARPWIGQDCEIAASLQRAARAPRPASIDAPAGSAVAAFRRYIHGAI